MSINVRNILRFGRHLHLDSQIYVEGDGGIGLQTVTRLISSAEIKAMNSSPITLVPAAPDKLIWATGGFYASKITTPFTVDGGFVSPTLNIQSGPSSASYSWLQSVDAQALTVGPGTVLGTFNVTANFAAPGSDFIGEPLQAAVWGASDPVDGEGELFISASYRIVDLSEIFG